MGARQFPIMGSKSIRSIPWAMIAPHEERALRNHSQSLEVLARRGGLSAYEANLVLDDEKWTGLGFWLPAEREAHDKHTAEQSARLRERVAPWLAANPE